jgi:5-methyltetrahydropteroyltriglutamate--homocysteine methyltransferase
LKRSTDRILVMHQGTLPREQALRDMVVAKEEGKDYNANDLDAGIKSAVNALVEQQVRTGIDIVNDGEQSKSGFSYYIRTRLSGHEERTVTVSPDAAPRNTSGRDHAEFPGFFQKLRGTPTYTRSQSFLTGPAKYIGQESVQQDIANLKAAMAGKDVAGGVLMSIAPGTIEHWMHNEHYGSEEDFLMAIADAMHEEYKAITDAGLIVQVDDPDLADGWQVYPEMSVPQYHAYADVRVEAMNRALKGINPEQVILHVCWGSFHTPHTNDLPLREIIDLFFKVNAQGVSIEQSNPRHEHEWAIFKDIKLPGDKILIPGVVGHITNMVEHPELVAQRLVRYADIVGRENVIAGTDCGIGSRVAHAEVAWAKLAAMAEGARIASKELWGK